MPYFPTFAPNNVGMVFRFLTPAIRSRGRDRTRTTFPPLTPASTSSCCRSTRARRSSPGFSREPSPSARVSGSSEQPFQGETTQRMVADPTRPTSENSGHLPGKALGSNAPGAWEARALKLCATVVQRVEGAAHFLRLPTSGTPAL